MTSGFSLAFVIMVASLAPLVEYHWAEDKEADRISALRHMSSLPTKETFDFIIVGAGSAGSILARRLSEKHRVLLLEAGGEPPPEELMSTLFDYMKYLPNINWFYNSTQQNKSSLENGGINIATAGRMMGGSYSHNGVQYERGNPLDYDHWANVTKDDSWRYQNILRYFLRTENYHGQFTTANGQHRVGGLVDVTRSEVTFRYDTFMSAGRDLGYASNIDTNGPQRVGFGPAEYNRRKGRRVSTYSAYVKPIEKHRKNLVVRRYSIVSNVLFENLVAVGVNYTRHGVPRVAFASKEVILSAGAYISPILLMRSGIGPRDQLQEKPLVELPVGLNLQDHVFVRMPLISVTDKSVFRYSPSSVTFKDFDEFRIHGTGFIAAYGALHEAFLPSNRTIQDGYPNWPDIQLYFNQAFANGSDFLTCNVNLNRERSRGRLFRNLSATTLEDSILPIVDYNFFSDETDYDVLLDAIEMCRRVVEETKTFRSLGAKFVDDVVPECQQFAPRSSDYWKCYIRQRASSNFHVTSTNSMGSPDDPNAVVDSKLRVRGVRNLRVVDASVMPFVLNANINAGVMMIAEKAAEEILRPTH